jgi:hypothetical protein
MDGRYDELQVCSALPAVVFASPATTPLSNSPKFFASEVRQVVISTVDPRINGPLMYGFRK